MQKKKKNFVYSTTVDCYKSLILLIVSWKLLEQNWAATWQNQQNGCAPSDDAGQPGYPSLIKVFAVRSIGS